MSDLRKCFSVHTVEEYLRLADQLDRAALRSPLEANDLRQRAALFRRLAANRKSVDRREGNFFKATDAR